MRTAKLLAGIINIIGGVLAKGKSLRQFAHESDFMPDYLSTEFADPAPIKSIEQQHAEFREFTARFRALQQSLMRNRGILT